MCVCVREREILTLGSLCAKRKYTLTVWKERVRERRDKIAKKEKFRTDRETEPDFFVERYFIYWTGKRRYREKTKKQDMLRPVSSFL